jgi:hypothetical protein
VRKARDILVTNRKIANYLRRVNPQHIAGPPPEAFYIVYSRTSNFQLVNN